MKLDRFINRPVLSTVISVLIVILGIIGLATLPVTANIRILHLLRCRYAPLIPCEFYSCIEFGYRSVGGSDKRCGEYDVYSVYSV